jgi:hypothetical protein
MFASYTIQTKGRVLSEDTNFSVRDWFLLGYTVRNTSCFVVRACGDNMIAGLIGVGILLTCLAWVGFSGWIGAKVGEITESEGLAVLTIIGLMFLPGAFIAGYVIFG